MTTAINQPKTAPHIVKDGKYFIIHIVEIPTIQIIETLEGKFKTQEEAEQYLKDNGKL